MWSKYRVQKKQIYQNGGWVDTDPLQTRTGEKIGEYDSFSGCSGIPPTPSNYKWIATYSGGTTSSAECDASSAITQNEIRLDNLVSVEIGDCVTSLGTRNGIFVFSPFYGASALASVTIGINVARILFCSFYSCTSLTSITIPSSVREIDVRVLSDCPNLTSIVVESGNSIYDSRNNCNAIIETATNTLINGCKTTIIPNSVTSIVEHAFEGCSGLTSVGLVGSGASIEIPNSVTNIGVDTFQDCSGLTSATIPYSVASIGYGVFAGCSNLTSIVVESGNPVYDSRNNCNAIIETETNKLIQGSNSTIIPNNVTSIGRYAFEGCSSMTSITIPNSVISIGEYAFGGCSGLTSINIPSSVTTIDGGAFSGCKGLTSVTIPSGITSVGNYTFYNCISLTSVTIPSGVTSIGNDAFYDCRVLTSITCLPTTPPTLGNYAFDLTNNCNILVPSASVNAYKSASGWSTYASRIQAIP